MFRLFRRRPKPPPPPAPASDPADYDRAWNDYVEWSGLDEDRLDEILRERDDG